MAAHGAQAWLDAVFPKDPDAEARANAQVEAHRVNSAASWQACVDSVKPSISFAGDSDTDMGRRAAKDPSTQLAIAVAEVDLATYQLAAVTDRPLMIVEQYRGQLRAARIRLREVEARLKAEGFVAPPAAPKQPEEQAPIDATAWAPHMPWSPSITYPTPDRPQ